MGSKVVNFQVVQFEPARVIGKCASVSVDVGIDDPTITDLWARMAKDGSFDALYALNPSRDTVGWMGDFTPGADHYTYLAGVLVAPGTFAPTGFESRDLEACELAVASIQRTDDDEGGDMFANGSALTNGAMAARGYEFDSSHDLFEMEVYTQALFRAPAERGEAPILDFCSPCKRMVVEPA